MRISEHLTAVEALPQFWHVMRGMSNLTQSEYEVSFQKLIKELKKVSKIELKLTAVHFPRNGGFDTLGKALQRCAYPRLKVLEITGNPINLDGVEELARAIRMGNLSKLQVISLTNCNISYGGAEVITEALQIASFAHLETFRIDENPIGSRGLLALARLLTSGGLRSVKALAFSFQGPYEYPHSRFAEEISMDAVETIGSALQSNHLSLLEDLTLRHIEQKGILVHLIHVMESSKPVYKLRSLTLADSNIGEPEAKALASAFNSSNFSSSLHSLSLGENKWVGDDGLAIKAIIQGFKSPYLSGLQTLKMETSSSKVDQSIDDKDLAEICELLEMGYLPALQTLHAKHVSNYHMARLSSPAVIRAYQNNPFLVTEVIMDWPSEDLKATADKLRSYNQKLGLKRHHPTEPEVEQVGVTDRLTITAKLGRRLKWSHHHAEPEVGKVHLNVLLCGESGVGRSTLRRTLCSSQWEALKQKWKDSSTHAVYKIVEKEFVLRVQEIGLPEILPADAPLTVFVVVCSANYREEAQENKTQAKQELLYWLNQIDSTRAERSQKGKRHVMVVLNSFGGAHSCHSEIDWTSFISLYSGMFEDSLNICPTPCILSALSRTEVMRFKENLIDFARSGTWKQSDEENAAPSALSLGTLIPEEELRNLEAG
ncbi:hypothetical protein R1flu_006992 [Riccia fluitans]|uniref:Uncharacterized protein n=1 Tax=Riccia fluitans TaxID=41844 RepID=A0ABD1YYD2_9MARC